MWAAQSHGSAQSSLAAANPTNSIPSQDFHGDSAPSHGQSPESPSLERQNSILLKPLGNLNLSLYTATPCFIIKISFLSSSYTKPFLLRTSENFLPGFFGLISALKGLLYCIVFRSYPVLQRIKNPENYDLYGRKQVVLKIKYIYIQCLLVCMNR